MKGRRFFVPGSDGGNEKYIKAKKVCSPSEKRCTFAVEIKKRLRVSAAFGIENELSLRSLARDLSPENEKQDNTKKRIL